MRLKWTVYLDLDQINALVLLVEDEGVADEDLEEAYRELVDARDHAVRSEVAWLRIDHWNEFPERLGLKDAEN